MRPTSGTTIVDVSDPANPKHLARIDVPDGWHSHKVRVANGIMLVNHEKFGKSGPDEFGGGLGIYDVSRPRAPKLITKWLTKGGGVHRFDFDGRYAYISPTAEGYVGNITMILDLADPAKPQEVGRWWIPGQWQAGGEDYPWTNWVPPRCHHPLRFGDRLYVSYWHHGFYILDISDLSKPKLISRHNTSPVFPHPTHTCLRIPQKLKGRDIMVVADEDVAKLWPAAPSFIWIYDITNETLPVPIATWQVPGLDPDGAPQPPMTGCHQPSERFHGTVDSLRLVRAGPAARRYRRSVQSARGRTLSAGAGAGRRTRVIERRHRRFARADLSGRPRAGRRHHRNISVLGEGYHHGRRHQDQSRKDVYPIGKKNPNLPFHPAVRAGDFIFVSGQVPKDETAI